MDITNKANRTDFYSGFFFTILGFTIDGYIKGMGVVELTHFFKLCKGIWMGLEDVRIFWILAKQTTFVVRFHGHFGNTVVDHYNRGLYITRYWAELNICHDEKLSYVAVFKFSNFGDNWYIKNTW